MYIGHVTYRYDVLVSGLLGVAVMYLLFFYVFHSGIDMSTEELLATPKKGKFFFFAIIGPIILYWATRQIFQLIWFLVDKF